MQHGTFNTQGLLYTADTAQGRQAAIITVNLKTGEAKIKKGEPEKVRLYHVKTLNI
ncbi:hypothetical protein GNIT_2645 [Glaciecola nitratireducens FR1064]|uniref:Uncharacterized protein n=1 Tax=Glaciecola nitratireducens (strain JCM 12485 / KCTC 12276 / FR1064) TaxID=1085623 RepID=G4QM90_GLANF|nr:hypothetical protein GNIT_2645 [Glaciecola nitratireducens FR1064]